MSEYDENPLEVEEAGGEFRVPADRRPHMEEPLPVNLVAVADVRALARVGQERELADFYVKLWDFAWDEEYAGLAFWAENFRLVFDLREGLVARQEMRPIGVEVRSLAEAEEKLTAREMEYVRQRGVQPGTESILLQDPAGNWVELTERREL